MGLKVTDQAEEKTGVDVAGAANAVSCSICLDAVADGGDRSTARLQCGHQFHLDCIGSAFNAKGLMQCPNCRKIEKGTWLYSSYRYPEFSMDDWPHDEDLYDLNYTEVPYGLHWCPFSRLARVPSSFEESDSSPSIPYHDLLGHPAVFAEHHTNPSSAHSCPYLAYFHPLQASSSSGSQVPVDNPVDVATFHHPWTSLSGPMDAQSSHTFPPSDLYYHHRWDSHSPPFSHPSNHGNNSIDQEPVSSGSTRSARIESDAHPGTGSFMQPFIVGHGSASRPSSSALSSLPPPYVASSRGHARVHDIHVSYQHHNTPSLLSGSRRSGGVRGMPPIVPTSSPPESAGFFLIAPSAATSRTSDVEGGSHFYAWERDRFAPFPLLPVDRDFSWWGPPPQASGSSDSSSRTGFWSRHNSSDRSSSQSRPPHAPRMHPFI